MKCIVMFSGGAMAWAAGKRAVRHYGVSNTTLLFADTGIEDEDLYRFRDEAAMNIGAPLVNIAEGRTPWQVFFAERFLGNSKFDPCSKILKRQLLDRWLADNCDPAETSVVMGFDWSEEHRMTRLVHRDTKWGRWAPLLDPPYLTKNQLLQWLREEGIEPPRLYSMGFSHNNCGGTCVKAGQAAWRLVYRELPERYAEWERNEQAIREFLGKPVSILTDRTGDGVKKPLTLREFRTRLESTGQYDMFDWGSCGCFQVAEEPDFASLEEVHDVRG